METIIKTVTDINTLEQLLTTEEDKQKIKYVYVYDDLMRLTISDEPITIISQPCIMIGANSWIETVPSYSNYYKPDTKIENDDGTYKVVNNSRYYKCERVFQATNINDFQILQPTTSMINGESGLVGYKYDYKYLIVIQGDILLYGKDRRIYGIYKPTPELYKSIKDKEVVLASIKREVYENNGTFIGNDNTTIECTYEEYTGGRLEGLICIKRQVTPKETSTEKENNINEIKQTELLEYTDILIKKIDRYYDIITKEITKSNNFNEKSKKQAEKTVIYLDDPYVFDYNIELREYKGIQFNSNDERSTQIINVNDKLVFNKSNKKIIKNNNKVTNESIEETEQLIGIEKFNNITFV